MTKIIFTIHPRTLPENVTTVREAVEWFHAEERRMLEATAQAIAEYVSSFEALAVGGGDDGESKHSAADGSVH